MFLDGCSFYLMELMATSLINLVYSLDGGVKSTAPLSFHHVFTAMHDAACGLRWLHDEREFPVVHGDLNLGNLMVAPVNDGRPAEWIVKITDFGCGRVFRSTDEKHHSIVGTVGFQAPEILRAYEGDGSWGPHIDQYVVSVPLLSRCAS